ncbi:GTPase LSG1-1 [Cryptomeria japonica]|uniref:GTPase LSG1-1 n=1 Tax=Cryptomeria japonica TaxID=3369 RepID=UPI0025AD5C44|nr:GTPase LSG1-1 [Cryptomeria japonica]
MTKNNEKGGLGRSLIKQRNQQAEEAKKHGYAKVKRVLESVTDIKDIELVVEEAEEAGRLFSAQNPAPDLPIDLDLSSTRNGLTPDEKKKQQKAEEALYEECIRIPRRPPWHANMSAEELDVKERQSFLNWRRGLARLEENEKLVITPFEKNIDIWRQLWRVLERSDLVVTVVDGRNPLFYRCPDLEEYVKEINSQKKTMLLVNKADLLPVYMRVKWAKYFHSQGILYVFWSAKAASYALEGKEGLNSATSVESTEELQKLVVSVEDTKIYGREELLNRLQKEAEAISTSIKASNHDSAHCHSGASTSNSSTLYPASTRVVVGFVGYPNVGKSSTINALVGEKKTGVTSTPGKTKHFQTLIISDKLMLCDCPGLVFPSFSSSRADMVAFGVLPIDRMTDHRAAIQVVAEKVPRYTLENIYRISLPKPKPYEPQDRPPAAFELLRTYARSRGYVGTGGLPDETRATRQILKDYIDGKLPHFEMPLDRENSVKGEDIRDYASPELQIEDSRVGLQEGALDIHDDQLGSTSSIEDDYAHGNDQVSCMVNGSSNEEAKMGQLLDVMGSTSLEGVLDDLGAFDSVNGVGSVGSSRKKNSEGMRAQHKMHKKLQRKKDRSWRAGNDDSDGMPAAKVVQKPVSHGAARQLLKIQ